MGAMAIGCELLPDCLDIGLQVGVVVYTVLLDYSLMKFTSLINFLGFTHGDKFPISANRVCCTAGQHQWKYWQQVFEITSVHFSIVVGIFAGAKRNFHRHKKKGA